MFICNAKDSKTGFWPLRSPNFRTRNRSLSLSFREFVGGVVVEDRLPYPEGFGQYVFDETSVGDIIGGQLWRVNLQDANQAREIPMWRFSTPVVIREPEEESGITASLCTDLDTQLFYSPIKEVDTAGRGSQFLIPDDRLQRFQYINPSCSQDEFVPVWNQMPAGVFGISLIANKEDNQQQNLFFPADPRLISSTGTDPFFSTQVCDVEGLTISTPCDDIPRTTSLNTLCRVIPDMGAHCGNLNDNLFRGRFLALQSTFDPCRRVVSGCMAFQQGRGRNYIGGMWSSERWFGPFHPGLPRQQDKHWLADDKDGNSINSLHIWTGANFFLDQEHDGPLKFDGDFDFAERGDIPHEVELVWDTDLQHDHVCPPRPPGDPRGKWRWVAYIGEESTDTPPYTPLPPPGGGVIIDPPPGDSIIDFDPGFPLPDGQPFVGYGGVYFAQLQSKSDCPKCGGIDLELKEKQGECTSCDNGATKVPLITDRDAAKRHFLLSHNEKAFPGLLFRPQYFSTDSIDVRNLTRGKSKALRAASKWFTPVVSRLEAIGYQEEPEWVYKKQPGDLQGRYPCPSSDGGAVWLSPDVGVEDFVTNVYDSTDDHATSSLVFAPDFSILKFGTPDPTNEEMVSSGFGLHLDTTNDDLNFRRWSGTAWTNVLTFDQSGSLVHVPSWDLQVAGDGTFDSDVLIAGDLVPQDAGKLSISSGVVTATGSYHSLESESASAADDLDTINGGQDGMYLLLKIDPGFNQPVTLKDGTGNLNLSGDFTMDQGDDRVMLQYDGDSSKWCQVSESNNS